MFNSGLSVADIAAATGANRNNDGFGGNNGWWILIILFAIFGGWGNNGYGRNDGGGGGITYNVGADVQRGFDTQGIMSSLRGIENGICSLGYDQLAQMNGINTNILQTGFGIQQAINGASVNNMQSFNSLSAQLANCCCENRMGQADLKYQMATDSCAITQAINQAAQNIMQNDNANYRQLHDEQIALQIQGYKDRIAEKDSLIQSLNLGISQRNQTNEIRTDIINELRNCPIGTYQVPNPNCCYGAWGGEGLNGYGYGRSGCNSGCGCNC